MPTGFSKRSAGELEGAIRGATLPLTELNFGTTIGGGAVTSTRRLELAAISHTIRITTITSANTAATRIVASELHIFPFAMAYFKRLWYFCERSIGGSDPGAYRH